MILKIRKKTEFATKKGFTLTELLIVLSLMGIIITTVIINYNEFNSQLLTNNAVYDVALNIREAQVLAIGVRGPSGMGQAVQFQAPYGVSFNTIDEFSLFLDSEPINYSCNDCETTCSGTTECLRKQKIQNRVIISDVCVGDSENSADICSSSNDVEKLDISFLRPNPDAIITINNSSQQYGYAVIKMESIGGDLQREVHVSSTGKINVK